MCAAAFVVQSGLRPNPGGTRPFKGWPFVGTRARGGGRGGAAAAVAAAVVAAGAEDGWKGAARKRSSNAAIGHLLDKEQESSSSGSSSSRSGWRNKQEANSASHWLGTRAIGRHSAAAERLLLKGTRCCSCRCRRLRKASAPSAAFFSSNECQVVELGHSPAPPAAARGSRQRPLRFGPYSRALTTATAPKASIRLRRMAGWRRRVARLGLGCCPRSSTAAAAALLPLLLLLVL